MGDHFLPGVGDVGDVDVVVEVLVLVGNEGQVLVDGLLGGGVQVPLGGGVADLLLGRGVVEGGVHALSGQFLLECLDLGGYDLTLYLGFLELVECQLLVVLGLEHLLFEEVVLLGEGAVALGQQEDLLTLLFVLDYDNASIGYR